MGVHQPSGLNGILMNVPGCPVCSTKDAPVGMQVYLLRGSYPHEMTEAGSLIQVVAVCHRCRFSCPLNVEHFGSDSEADSEDDGGEACDTYLGVCETCGRPPGEHPEL